jgi:toxin-antitoxin system PIN domain toxin
MAGDIPDVNLLVALIARNHPLHERALEWFASAGNFSTTPITETSLLRLVTNKMVVGEEISMGDAFRALDAVRLQPSWSFIPDTVSLAASSRLRRATTGSRQITDFHLLNLAIANGVKLVTFDNKMRAALTSRELRHLEILT